MPRIDAAPCMRAPSANPKPVKAIASAIARVTCVAGEPSSVDEISVRVSFLHGFALGDGRRTKQ